MYELWIDGPEWKPSKQIKSLYQAIEIADGLLSPECVIRAFRDLTEAKFFFKVFIDGVQRKIQACVLTASGDAETFDFLYSDSKELSAIADSIQDTITQRGE